MIGNAPKFFCLEGIDGCGKSTQLKLLAEFLSNEGFDVLTLREPGGSEISEKIRALLLDVRYKDSMSAKTELLLYSAARAQLVAEKIVPALESGKVILADRFAWSTLAYQGYGRGLDRDTILSLSDIACGKFAPSLTIVLDISLEESRRRQESAGRVPDRLESESSAFFGRVLLGYRQMAADFPGKIALIDAAHSVEEIQRQIRQLVLEKLR